MAYVLPTHYFHVVFTLPHELVALALRNRKPIFSLLFAAAALPAVATGWSMHEFTRRPSR